MSVPVFWKAEHHERSRTVLIGYDLASIRDHRLELVGIENFQSPGFEYLPDNPCLFNVLHEMSAAGQFGKSLFRDVVFSGAKATGTDYYFAVTELFIEI